MSSERMDRIERRVRRALERSGAAGSTAIVAVSGGGDSVALLRAVAAVAPSLRLTPVVAHLNHGVRGAAADADEQFVAELAARLGLDGEVGRWVPERPGDFEAQARRARYAWLLEVARRRSAWFVLVGHTKDDQAETVLHRILRGTGPTGLAGMARRRSLGEGVRLLRPLLTTTRAEAREYLEALGQSWVEDASNTDPERTRSRIRHELLPNLAESHNPRIVEALVRLADLSRLESGLARRRVEALAAEAIAKAEPDGIDLDRAVFEAQPLGERLGLIRLAWKRAGWPEREMTAERWLRLARLDWPRFSIGAGFEALQDGPFLKLRPERHRAALKAKAPTAAPQALDLPGSTIWQGWWVAASIEGAGPFQADSESEERIDLDALEPYPGPNGPRLILQAADPTMRFDPLGMKGKTTTVSAFLRGRGMLLEARGFVPILRDQRGIVWVVGHRIAERVRLTDRTRGVLRLRGQRAAGA